MVMALRIQPINKLQLNWMYLQSKPEIGIKSGARNQRMAELMLLDRALDIHDSYL